MLQAAAVPRPLPVVPDAALGEPREPAPEVDPLDGESHPDAARAEQEARAIMEGLDRGARAIAAAALSSGRDPLDLVILLRRAARVLEVRYRGGRDQRAHHRDGRALEGGDPATRKARYRVAGGIAIDGP